MTTQIQRRRGTTAQHSTFTGAVGEVTVDTDKEVLVVHDGAQVGGYPQMRENGSNSALALGSAGTPSLKFAGDTNTGIYSPGADQVAISTGGSGRLFVDASGNVGLGSSNPTSRLQSAGTVHITSGGTPASGAGLEIGYGNAASSTSSVISYDRTGASWLNTDYRSLNHIFFTNGTERLRITSAGLVGIGTSSPAQLLHLSQSGTGDFTSIRFANTGASGRSYDFGLGGNTTGLPGAFYLYDNNAAATRLLINSSGNVGIGTTSPRSTLTVAGQYSIDNNTTDPNDGASYLFQQGGVGWNLASTNIAFSTGGSGSRSERARIDSAGRLLVGTSSARSNFFNATANPTFQLDGGGFASITRSFNDEFASVLGLAKSRGTGNTIVQSNDCIGSVSYQGNDGSEFVEAAGIAAFVDGTPGANDMPGRLVFSTTADGASSPTERMRIDSSGRVGIGTTIPATTLFVSGESTFDNTTVSACAFNRNGVKVGDIGGTAGGAGFSFRSSASTPIVYQVSSTEVARIDSSGRLLVGTSTTVNNGQGDARLQVASNNYYTADFGQFSNDAFGGAVYFKKTRSTTAGGFAIVADGDYLGDIRFAGTDGANYIRAASIECRVDGTPGTNDMPGRLVFSTTADGASSPTERMRIHQGGQIGIGSYTGTNPVGDNATSVWFNGPTGVGYLGAVSEASLYLNRKTTDGTIVDIRQDGTSEGTISVSGTTVSYNGAHLSRWSQLPSGAERTEILRGTVLSNIDEMCEWGEEENEQLNRMKVSDVEGDKNVSGVFQAWDDDDDTYTNDFYCAMTGDFIIRIGAGVTVERGDLLMSAGDGTAKPQDDDIIRSKTIAKVTSTNVSCTYDDGSYCVPCVLMAC